jgi:hypothetical protein
MPDGVVEVGQSEVDDFNIAGLRDQYVFDFEI